MTDACGMPNCYVDLPHSHEYVGPMPDQQHVIDQLVQIHRTTENVLRGRCRQLEQENAALKEMLRKYQFVNEGIFCPECWYAVEEHDPECALAKLLG